MKESVPLHDKGYFKEPPRRRVGVHAPFRTEGDRLLLVKKQWKVTEGDPHPWGIIGGSAGKNELPRVAWRREIKSRIGLEGLRPRAGLLVVDHVPEDEYAEGTNYVYEAADGACILAPDAALDLHPHLTEHRFVVRGELGNYLSEHSTRRALAVLHALEKDVTLELELGHPAGYFSDQVAG